MTPTGSASATAATLLDLTRYEYGLLAALLQRPGAVLSRAQLMDRVWGDALDSGDRTVDTHIKTLRAKLREVAPDADPIRTHRGLGYSLECTTRHPRPEARREARRMKIGLRIFLGYFVIVALAALLLARVFVAEVKPGVRQAMEDTLVDTANVLAELATDDLLAGRINDGDFARRVRAMRERDIGAEIWGFGKRAAQLPHLRHRCARHRRVRQRRTRCRQGLLALERRLPDPARPLRRAFDAQRSRRPQFDRDARGRADPRRRTASSAC